MSKIQLLVSVKNCQEALVAATAGADIVDIKDPDQGSLGFAGWATITAIVRSVKRSCVVSAALGELYQWQNQRTLQATFHAADLPSLQFAKIGLARQCKSESHLEHSSAWLADWQSVRTNLQNVKQWVAVAYSDFACCGTPHPQRVLDAAIETNCRVFLLDTFVKDGLTTFDHLSEVELRGLAQRSQTAGIKIAIAGQVSVDNVESFQAIRPDIVAVRGAVCEGEDRRRSIQQDQVVKLKAALNSLS